MITQTMGRTPVKKPRKMKCKFIVSNVPLLDGWYLVEFLKAREVVRVSLEDRENPIVWILGTDAPEDLEEFCGYATFVKRIAVGDDE